MSHAIPPGLLGNVLVLMLADPFLHSGDRPVSSFVDLCRECVKNGGSLLFRSRFSSRRFGLQSRETFGIVCFDPCADASLRDHEFLRYVLTFLAFPRFSYGLESRSFRRVTGFDYCY